MQSLLKDQLAFIHMNIHNVHKKSRASTTECDPSCSFENTYWKYMNLLKIWLNN